jgi:steroid 5-alpha reductase family enzyme
VFISGFGALTRIGQWIVACIGYLAIIYIMFSGAKRLETRQSMNYGANPEYQIYVKKTPILIPIVPLHSLLGWSFIKI